MTTNSKDLADFENLFEKEEFEALVLISDNYGGGRIAGDSNSWIGIKDPLAYVDLRSNVLNDAEGQIQWFIPKDEEEQNGIDWPYNFQGGIIYKLKVRELIDKTIPEGMLPSVANLLMVVEKIEEGSTHPELNSILAEYRKPVLIEDEEIGTFLLDKDSSTFEGSVKWLNTKINAKLEINPDNKSSWTKAKNRLKEILKDQVTNDKSYKEYIVNQLLEQANDWQQQEDLKELTKIDFRKKISLSEISVSSSGKFSLYFDDGDVFFGHTITVSGSLKKGLLDVSI